MYLRDIPYKKITWESIKKIQKDILILNPKPNDVPNLVLLSTQED